MRRKIKIVGWIIGLAALVGCVSSDAGEPTTVTLPTPTTHPLFSGQESGDAVPEDSTPEPEETAVQIDNVDITVGDSDAVVTWTTSSLAFSEIAYGRTELYELGRAGDVMPLTRHAVFLDLLEPETTYYYQITALDTETGTAYTANGSLETISLAPTIDVWYGSEQKYGNVGIPKRWFNVFGNVYDRDGVATLSYSLNGGPDIPLSIGPDLRRLANVGDFNADINRDNLIPGRNEVVITAADALGYERSITVGVTYETGNVWPGNYEVDWQTVSNIQDVAQVVDGKWEIDNGDLHIVEPNYDRLVAIGDVTWTDYEVEVPITLHRVFDEGFSVINNGPALGLLIRWTGHTDTPIADWQPKVGWKPFGVLAWYWWEEPDLGFWLLEGTGEVVEELPAAAPQFDVTYMLKVRVETVSDEVGLYSMKVWPQDEPEPDEWLLSAEVEGHPNGSFLLLAHHVDIRFGNVKVTQLAPPTNSPVFPDLSVSTVITATPPITTTLSITGTTTLSDTAVITGTAPITGTTTITNTGSAP